MKMVSRDFRLEITTHHQASVVQDILGVGIVYCCLQ